MAVEQPAKLPQWATNANRTLEPALGEKQVGWEVQKKPPARLMNWLLNNLYTWMQYLQSPKGTGAGAGVDALGGDTSGPGLRGTGGAPNGGGVIGLGDGAGKGVSGTGDTTGIGVEGVGGSVSGAGVHGVGTAGNASGVFGEADGSGTGCSGLGGDASGAGARGTGGTPNGIGTDGVGTGTGSGVKGTGDTTGFGVEGVGGSVSGAGVRGQGTAGNASGVVGAGQGSGTGCSGTGGATGPGVKGNGTAGYGVVAESDTTLPTRSAMRWVPQNLDPSTAIEGDAYANSVTHKLRFHNGTDWHNVSPQQHALITPASQSNTAAGVETLMGGEGTFTIPADILNVRSTIRFSAMARVENHNLGPDLLMKVRIGGIAGELIALTADVAAVIDNLYILEGVITVRTVGGAGTAQAKSLGSIGPSSGGIDSTILKSGGTAGLGEFAIDTTGTLDLVVTCDFSAQHANNVVTLEKFVVDVV